MTAILDTGFIFALTDKTDDNHARVLKVAQSIGDEPLVLPSVVIPEVCYLIGSRLGHKAMRDFLNHLITSKIQIEPLSEQDLKRVVQILEVYADGQLDFVDAAVIAIAERLNIIRVLTIDRRDFSLIRPVHCTYFELFP